MSASILEHLTIEVVNHISGHRDDHDVNILTKAHTPYTVRH